MKNERGTLIREYVHYIYGYHKGRGRRKREGGGGGVEVGFFTLKDKKIISELVIQIPDDP